jgi:glutamyl-tRNA reductase
VISSTGAPEPILTRKLVKRAMKRRRYVPQVICDIAVPRDAETAVGDVDGVYLFDVDDLQKAVAENLKERAKEAEEAAVIVDREVAEFGRWLETQAVVPTIRALREMFSAIALAEADKAIAALESKESPEQREQAVRRLAEVIANKLLHQPMVALKDREDREQAQALVSATRKLFALDDEQDHEEPQAAAATEDGGRPIKNRGPA